MTLAPAWPDRATPVAHPVRRTADTDGMDARRRQSPHALPPAVRAAALACVLAAAVLLALGAAPSSRAAAYGDGAAIPFLLLPGDNPWNTPVDALPLDPNSADYIAHMSPSTGLHPDFGTVWEGARIGIPYVVVPGAQPKGGAFSDESRHPGPLPDSRPDAPVEGAGGPYADGDRHVLVLDADHKKLYEVYDGHRQADGSWRAGSGAVFDLTSNALRPAGWTSADAAGLPILPGLARYDEIVGEGVLDHALRFTVADTRRSYVYPATHFASDSEDPDLPPMGLRVRLRADFDVSGFPCGRPDDPGAEVRDDGRRQRRRLVRGRVAGLSLEDDEALALEGVTGGDFEVVDWRALPAGAFYVSLPATATAREGVRWSRAGGYFDGAGALWTATVDYAAGPGDQTLPLTTGGGEGQSGAFTLSHTWPDDGRRTVRVAVTSELARMATATVAVSVRNVAPKVAGGRDVRVHAGARLAPVPCSFRDPGADVWKGWVSYGDGSARQALRLRADMTFRLSHRFAGPRGRRCTVTLCVTDDDGGRGLHRFAVAVR